MITVLKKVYANKNLNNDNRLIMTNVSVYEDIENYKRSLSKKTVLKIDGFIVGPLDGLEYGRKRKRKSRHVEITLPPFDEKQTIMRYIPPPPSGLDLFNVAGTSNQLDLLTVDGTVDGTSNNQVDLDSFTNQFDLHLYNVDGGAGTSNNQLTRSESFEPLRRGTSTM